MSLLNQYGTVKRPIQHGSRQVGGEMGAAPAPGAAPEGGAPAGAPAEGGDQLQQMLAEVVRTQDPNMALEFCNMLAEGMAAQGGAPEAGAPPAEGQPAMAQTGAQVKNGAPAFSITGELD